MSSLGKQQERMKESADANKRIADKLESIDSQIKEGSKKANLFQLIIAVSTAITAIATIVSIFLKS